MAAPESDWKNKYLKSLDQIERMQQNERMRLEVMRRGLARVSVAAQGQDEQLDARLDAVRNALRHQRDILELEPLLDELEQAVKMLDSRRRKQHAAAADALDAQLGQYLAGPLDRASRRRLLAFRKKFPELAGVRNAQGELFRQFSAVADGIIREQMSRIETLTRRQGPGFWARWFGAATPATVDDAEGVASAETPAAMTQARQEASAAAPAMPPGASLVPAEAPATEPPPVSRTAPPELLQPESAATPLPLPRVPAAQASGTGLNSIPAAQRTPVAPMIEAIIEPPLVRRPALVAVPSSQVRSGPIIDDIVMPAPSREAVAALVAEMNLAEAPGATARVDIDLDTRERIRVVLVQLLERIDAPAALQARRDALLQRLAQPSAWTVLPGLLAETSEWLDALRTAGQEDLGNFLVALYQRLQDIQDFLLNARTREAQSYVHQQALADDVRTELAHLREQADSESADLGRVRADIEKTVGRILAAMTDYQTIEQERHEQLHAGMDAMTARLSALTHESDTLRQALEEQRQAALRDPLTELPNRTACDERLNAEINRARLRAKPLSIAVIDLDLFGEINSRLGHLRGDKVLRLVAREIRRRVRADDFVGRHGGGTFMVVSPGFNGRLTSSAMDVVRQAVANCPFNFNGERIPVTVSCGVATLAAGEGSETLFERADQALREARRDGVNRIVLAGD